MLKRQRTEEPSPPNVAEETALKIILTSDKATAAIAFPTNGSRPHVRLANEKASELMSQLLEGSDGTNSTALSFWKSVQSAARGERVTEDEFFHTSGTHLRIKYRRTEVKDETIVIVTAKKVVVKKEAGVKTPPPPTTTHSSHETQAESPLNELSSLVNALEEDVVNKVLGNTQMHLSLLQFQDRGVFRYLAVNSELAHFLQVPSPQAIRGKTSCDLTDPSQLHLTQPSDELNMLLTDTAILYDQLHCNWNPVTKTSNFAIRFEQFPGATFFCALREVMSGTYLCMTIVHNRPLRVPGPRIPSAPLLGIPKMWVRNRWDEFVEDCLRYLHTNRKHASEDRIKLPEAFLNNSENVYCYAYQGQRGFLPSGDSDGYRWKSSRGAVCAGNLQRKYFYTELPDGRKLRRRVMWLEDIKGLCVIEYRHFTNNGNTEAEHLMAPECMDWPKIIREVSSQLSQRFTATVDRISSHFEMGETRVDQAELGSGNVVSYVNGILHNWASEFGRNVSSIDGSTRGCLCSHLRSLSYEISGAASFLSCHLPRDHRGSQRKVQKILVDSESKAGRASEARLIFRRHGDVWKMPSSHASPPIVRWVACGIDRPDFEETILQNDFSSMPEILSILPREDWNVFADLLYAYHSETDAWPLVLWGIQQRTRDDLSMNDEKFHDMVGKRNLFNDLTVKWNRALLEEFYTKAKATYQEFNNFDTEEEKLKICDLISLMMRFQAEADPADVPVMLIKTGALFTQYVGLGDDILDSTHFFWLDIAIIPIIKNPTLVGLDDLNYVRPAKLQNLLDECARLIHRYGYVKRDPIGEPYQSVMEHWATVARNAVPHQFSMENAERMERIYRAQNTPNPKKIKKLEEDIRNLIEENTEGYADTSSLISE
ncbi:hypothetical protein PROFUN_05242, partial [Planoprotostelium fungivorum]